MFTDMLFNVLLVYLLIINAVGFILMLVDKVKAKKNLWRIPEATLFLVAAIGGSVGSILGMYTFRHKTRHRRFSVGLPLIFIAQAILILLLVKVIG